jgi:hypothetical protein
MPSLPEWDKLVIALAVTSSASIVSLLQPFLALLCFPARFFQWTLICCTTFAPPTRNTLALLDCKLPTDVMEKTPARFCGYRHLPQQRAFSHIALVLLFSVFFLKGSNITKSTQDRTSDIIPSVNMS